MSFVSTFTASNFRSSAKINGSLNFNTSGRSFMNVPFCQMAQRNLPVTREKTNKSFNNEKVLRRRVGIF